MKEYKCMLKAKAEVSQCIKKLHLEIERCIETERKVGESKINLQEVLSII